VVFASGAGSGGKRERKRKALRSSGPSTSSRETGKPGPGRFLKSRDWGHVLETIGGEVGHHHRTRMSFICCIFNEQTTVRGTFFRVFPGEDGNRKGAAGGKRPGGPAENGTPFLFDGELAPGG